MIFCRLADLAERCRQRGYTLEEVSACIVQRGTLGILVDEAHPAYPRTAKPDFVPPPEPPARVAAEAIDAGPGTELKKLLKKIGIVATPNCACNARARIMDEKEAQEPGWCEQHINMIVGWLREEATNRSLPFVDAIGRMLVKRAIKNARAVSATPQKP